MAVRARATARRREGYAHDVEVDGHALVVDEPEAAGGTNLGPSPTRLVAAGLASCTAITVEMYAERKGWELGAVETDVDVHYEGYQPTAFEVTLRIESDLSDEQLDRLLVIAGKCPVHRALASETHVSIEDRIERV
jgi:putative redox protein